MQLQEVEYLLYTEFSGSTCAESAVESLVSYMDDSEKPALYFHSTADIKPSCRSVAARTRVVLSPFILVGH